MSEKLQRALTGFASGVMVAASFFSLIVPALEQADEMGKLKFIPVSIGFAIGMLFLLVLDMVTPHMHFNNCEEGPRSGLKRTTKLVLAVTLHNLPEGMAVGIVCAGWMYGNASITFTGALALSLGIAIQNFPEGAIVSVPLLGEGVPKGRTFLYGVLSGIVEPIGALLVIAASALLIPTMPYLLSFAAGAMIYVVVEELIPEMSEGPHSNIATICFAVGFILMMSLDVGLG
nr:ZIP family metal transporter [Pseudobutyrivibrio sp. YE44]